MTAPDFAHQHITYYQLLTFSSFFYFIDFVSLDTLVSTPSIDVFKYYLIIKHHQPALSLELSHRIRFFYSCPRRSYARGSYSRISSTKSNLEMDWGKEETKARRANVLRVDMIFWNALLQTRWHLIFHIILHLVSLIIQHQVHLIILS